MPKVTLTGEMIRVDVWGGEGSSDHLARYHLALGDVGWEAITRDELRRGFLVNLRVLGVGEGWGQSEDFDERQPMVAGHS